MSRRLEDVGGTLQELTDWMVQTEKKLGSQQPINEQTKPLSSQLDRHRVSLGTRHYLHLSEGPVFL